MATLKLFELFAAAILNSQIKTNPVIEIGIHTVYVVCLFY